MHKSHQHLMHEIAEYVIKECRYDESGISWETLQESHEEGYYTVGTSYNLSKGSLGLCLFLIEYYSLYQKDNLIEVINLSIKKCYNHYLKNEREIGFYSGRGGAIYVLLKGYQVLGETEYLTWAQNLALRDYSKDNYCNIDSGFSGLLISLGHLYTVAPKKELEKRIVELCKIILKSARLNQHGIYWDERFGAMSPELGFLYGTAGIIFVLREIAKLFEDNQLFSQVISEAINYSDSFFKKSKFNWPDFFHEELFKYNFEKKKSIINGFHNEELFYKPGYIFSWAAGSPGTLLGRNLSSKQEEALSFSELNFNESSIEFTTDFSLYKGLSGYALSLMSLKKKPRIDRVLDGINNQFKKYSGSLTYYPNNKELVDLTFLRGESGIGYFLAKTHPNNTDNSHVLFPCIDHPLTSQAKISSLDSKTVKEEVLKFQIPESVLHSISWNSEDTFYQLVRKILSKPLETHQSVDMERQKALSIFRCKEVRLNFHYEHFKNYFLKEKSGKLKINKIRIDSTICQVNIDEKPVIIKRVIEGAIFIELNDFGMTVLNKLSKTSFKKTNTVINEVLDDIEIGNAEEKKFARDKVIAMIKELIFRGVLFFI